MHRMTLRHATLGYTALHGTAMHNTRQDDITRFNALHHKT